MKTKKSKKQKSYYNGTNKETMPTQTTETTPLTFSKKTIDVAGVTFALPIYDNLISATEYDPTEGNMSIFLYFRKMTNILNVIENALYESDYDTLDSKNEELLCAADDMLEQHPPFFLNYGMCVSIYYTFKGISEYQKGNILEARKIFLTALVYEFLFYCRTIQVRTFDSTFPALQQYAAENSFSTKNFNILSPGQEFKDPFNEIGINNYAKILCEFLLFLSDKNGISRFAVWSYLQNIYYLILVGYCTKKIDSKYASEFREISYYRDNLEYKYTPMTQRDWNYLKLPLRGIYNDLLGKSSINNLIDYLWSSRM